jgi:hypothetical protein
MLLKGWLAEFDTNQVNLVKTENGTKKGLFRDILSVLGLLAFDYLCSG